MAKTVSVYQATENGLLRLDTFRPHNATSVRHIAEQIRQRYPNMVDDLYIAPRMFVFGKWVDGEPVKAD